jgi:hypothetical protein
MSCQRVFLNQAIAWVAPPSLALFLAVVPAISQTSNSGYTLLVGAGFVCDSGDSSACPAVVKSADGASYEITGAGTLAPQSKSVVAAGTYTQKSSGGDVLETGVWLASELVSFDSYGIAPGALMREGRALGPQQFGPRRSRMFSSSMPAGGLAVLRIHLLPVLGFAKNATLQVNCALGNVPRERSVEGIRLTSESNGTEFSEEVSGRVMFLSMHPEVSGPAKTPQQETAPGSVEQPSS